MLVLAIAYKGGAIPIYWLPLNKKGNSNSRERIALLKRFIKQFGKDKLIAVLADREFIGATWFKWLKTEGIDFHIRIKKMPTCLIVEGKWCKRICYFGV